VGGASSGVEDRRRRGHKWLRVRRRVEISLGGPAMVLAIALVVLLLVLATVLVYFGEHGHNPNAGTFRSVVGWAIEELAVGHPWDPVTRLGRSAFFAIELLRPVSFGLIIAALTTNLVQLLLRGSAGKGRSKLKDHIVVCGWSSKGPEIISQLRKRDDERDRPVVILALLAENPSRDDLTTFVHGDPTKAEDLKRAAIEHAQTAIVLADNSLPGVDVEDVDSRSLVTVLNIETLAPQVYTCVEVFRSENHEHFRLTKADEIVVSGRLTGALLAHSAATHGLSKVVHDLLSFPEGNEFYWVAVPARLGGRPFRDVLFELKEQANCLPVALADKDSEYHTNPPSDHVVQEGDRLLVIAPSFPSL
jgi:voltage-gated potassium channel